MKTTKDHRRFLKDLQKEDFPFKDFVTSNKKIRNTLFAEYLQTDKEPKLTLYIGNYFTDREIENGILEANDKIPNSSRNNQMTFASESTDFEVRIKEIEREYYSKISPLNGTVIDNEYYGHILANTPIIESLKIIDQELEDFKKIALKPKEAEYHFESISLIAQNISIEIKAIKSLELKTALLEAIRNDNENTNYIPCLITKTYSKNEVVIFKEKHRALKRKLDSCLTIKSNEQLQQSNQEKPDEVYKTQNLFKVGLLFAKGELYKYFTVNASGETVMKNEFSAPKIANDLGNESYNKWILASINNYPPDNPNGNKNIFNSLDMMNKIISHCEAEKTPVDPYFKERMPI